MNESTTLKYPLRVFPTAIPGTIKYISDFSTFYQTNFKLSVCLFVFIFSDQLMVNSGQFYDLKLVFLEKYGRIQLRKKFKH